LHDGRREYLAVFGRRRSLPPSPSLFFSFSLDGPIRHDRSHYVPLAGRNSLPAPSKRPVGRRPRPRWQLKFHFNPEFPQYFSIPPGLVALPPALRRLARSGRGRNAGTRERRPPLQLAGTKEQRGRRREEETWTGEENNGAGRGRKGALSTEKNVRRRAGEQ